MRREREAKRRPGVGAQRRQGFRGVGAPIHDQVVVNRITEEGDNRITEEGDLRILES